MQGVSLDVSCGRTQLFPGMETELRYKVQNEKSLPLIWMELSQNASERACVEPDETFERYTYQCNEETGKSIMREAYRRRFSFVMGYETLELTSRWTAVRRGLYRPKELMLRSGDGFGLTQVEQVAPIEKVPELVVYPKRVAVDISMFLHSDWERSAGSVGFTEDMSILRGLRPYQTTDGWKRINWRMAAKNAGELKSNFYETIQPSSVLFVLDGESFCGKDRELEETLEVLGSVISELFERGVFCGLCLPVSKRFFAVSLPPVAERSSAELLYYLAGYECAERYLTNAEGVKTGKHLPADFDIPAVMESALESGMIAVVTCDPDEIPVKLMRQMERHVVRVFSAGKTECTDTEQKVLPLSCLRKGERA